MKTLLITFTLLFGVTTAAFACPQGYYACGQSSALCCPR